MYNLLSYCCRVPIETTFPVYGGDGVPPTYCCPSCNDARKALITPCHDKVASFYSYLAFGGGGYRCSAGACSNMWYTDGSILYMDDTYACSEGFTRARMFQRV